MWRTYKRKGSVNCRPVTPAEIEYGLTADISISTEDMKNGSPKEGDMIARNPDNHADKWLINKEYFEKNYELFTSGL